MNSLFSRNVKLLDIEAHGLTGVVDYRSACNVALTALRKAAAALQPFEKKFDNSDPNFYDADLKDPALLKAAGSIGKAISHMVNEIAIQDKIISDRIAEQAQKKPFCTAYRCDGKHLQK